MWRPVAPGHAATTRNEIREVSVPRDVGFAFALGMGQDWQWTFARLVLFGTYIQGNNFSIHELMALMQ